MAFCAICEREYPPEIVLCQKCGGELTEEPPTEEETEIVRLVPLTAVDGVVEGSMLLGALESQGLHPRLVNHILPAHGDVLRDWSTHHWGDIRVPEDEIEEARLVLEDFREAVRRFQPLNGEDVSALTDPDPPEETAAIEPPAPLAPVEPLPGASGEAGPPSETAELVALCAIGNLAEGKMLEGALRSQGLHPVLAPSPESPWKPGSEGEIRVPPHELLEARAVLQDFQNAAERSRDETGSGGPASEE